jgi:hypothetical protein
MSNINKFTKELKKLMKQYNIKFNLELRVSGFGADAEVDVTLEERDGGPEYFLFEDMNKSKELCVEDME